MRRESRLHARAKRRWATQAWGVTQRPARNQQPSCLSSQRFSFDLMGDGNEVAMPLLQRGSGFLVLDAREKPRKQRSDSYSNPLADNGVWKVFGKYR